MGQKPTKFFSFRKSYRIGKPKDRETLMAINTLAIQNDWGLPSIGSPDKETLIALTDYQNLNVHALAHNNPAKVHLSEIARHMGVSAASARSRFQRLRLAGWISRKDPGTYTEAEDDLLKDPNDYRLSPVLNEPLDLVEMHKMFPRVRPQGGDAVKQIQKQFQISLKKCLRYLEKSKLSNHRIGSFTDQLGTNVPCKRKQ